MATAAREDSSRAVRDTLRFGWSLAELRGRFRLGPDHVALPKSRPPRTLHVVPLSQERSETEQKLETTSVVCSLAKQLGLDFEVKRKEHGRYEAAAKGSAGAVPATEELDSLADHAIAALRDAEKKKEEKDVTDLKQWPLLTELIWKIDAHTQDELALRPTEAAAYQAGRGLAEAYWALDAHAGDDDAWSSWTYLLGDDRRTFLKRQAGRLSAHLDPLTLPAITGSLDAWGEVATSPPWREQDDARKLLFEQTLLWRDLLRGERDPRDLLAERRGGWWPRISWPLVRSFLPQLVFGILSLALLAVGIVALAKGDSAGVLAPLGTLLGSLGVTSAGLYARAKATVRSKVEAARTAYVKDLIGNAATIAPKPPLRVASRRRLRLGA